MYRVLTLHEKAAVKVPTTEQVKDFKCSFKNLYPTLEDVFCLVVGLKVRPQKFGKVVKNMIYNDWTHKHNVENVFVFTLNGKIILCAVSAPNSLHDSCFAEWGSIYRKSKKHTTTKVGSVL